MKKFTAVLLAFVLAGGITLLGSGKVTASQDEGMKDDTNQEEETTNNDGAMEEEKGDMNSPDYEYRAPEDEQNNQDNEYRAPEEEEKNYPDERNPNDRG